MDKWFFPSTDHGAIEGFNNPGLAMFKGEPIRAMAREICQNSLDARKSNSEPVRLEFERYFKRVDEMPGLEQLKGVLIKCKEFWKNNPDERAKNFIENAIKILSSDKIWVLRISDYNTVGLRGAFSSDVFTPWKGLVQGEAITIKADDLAAGSFGIGKAAPFAVSDLQTVFYRTLDEVNVRAAQGVTHLVSFNDKDQYGRESIKRSTGYFGAGNNNEPFRNIELLDRLHLRTSSGTDLFIMGFNSWAGKGDWMEDIAVEILENFVYSIYSGKLEITIEEKGSRRISIAKNSLPHILSKFMPKTKHSTMFYNVINEENTLVKELKRDFYGMGELRLRLLYSPEANKKVLVVRNSGMKISNIQSLPKGISFVGFLELCGDNLNKFFRGMENPQHNKWEPNRHAEPTRAKRFKDEVEDWVRNAISEQIKKICGDEVDIDVTACFFAAGSNDNRVKDEVVSDNVKNIEIHQDEVSSKTFKMKDGGGNIGKNNTRTRRGRIDDQGDAVGHRHRDGERPGGKPTGRKGLPEDEGEDVVYDKNREVDVFARIIKKSDGTNKLIFKVLEDLSYGALEIVTVGENGRMLKLNVKSVKSDEGHVNVEDGRIALYSIAANVKYSVEFELYTTKTYAMGVRAYEN